MAVKVLTKNSCEETSDTRGNFRSLDNDTTLGNTWSTQKK